jgi:cell division protein FtsL
MPLKSIAFSLLKLAISIAVVLLFVEADISVQVILIYLLYMMIERSNETTALKDKLDIQQERIDELELSLNRLKSRVDNP